MRTMAEFLDCLNSAILEDMQGLINCQDIAFAREALERGFSDPAIVEFCQARGLAVSSDVGYNVLVDEIHSLACAQTLILCVEALPPTHTFFHTKLVPSSLLWPKFRIPLVRFQAEETETNHTKVVRAHPADAPSLPLETSILGAVVLGEYILMEQLKPFVEAAEAFSMALDALGRDAMANLLEGVNTMFPTTLEHDSVSPSLETVLSRDSWQPLLDLAPWLYEHPSEIEPDMMRQIRLLGGGVSL